VKEIFGGSVEVIEVPAGKTIEDVVREREAPATNPAPDNAARDEARQNALKAVRKAQADMLRRYDLLKELEQSIATPESERTHAHTIREVILSLQLKMS
jgi:hypothetical protein